MRRLLALSFVAAAVAAAAPAHAGDIACTPTPAGVCVGNAACPGRCFPEPYFSVYCHHPTPPSVCDVALTQIGAL